MSEDSDVGDAGSRPHCLCEPQGSLPVWQHRGSRRDTVPLLVLQEPAHVQEILEVPRPFSLVRGLQPMDVELVLDVPASL